MIDLVNLSAALKVEVTMKMFLNNKFSKQENFTRKDLPNQYSKNKGEANLSLSLLVVQPIQNLNTFYQMLTCC